MDTNETIVSVKNLTKAYKLYDSPLDRLKEAINPFNKQYHRLFYALGDVSFDIKRGEAIGILGRNGSGKSTLLKIITGVLTPTSGSVKVNGKIAALLELGAGFNPEMTGLENIYLSGTIMGFTKKEMQEKLVDILKFADIGDFVYQPVKMYSSGMLVRLAFSVQTQVNPELLIVDEALAVGDALFQKRCFQKIDELVTSGTTLLFVSHDQELVRTMTNKAIFLSNGKVMEMGSSSDVVLAYRKFLHNEEKQYWESVTQDCNKKTMQKSKESISEDSSLTTVQKEKTISDEICKDRFSFGDMDAEILGVQVLNELEESQNVFYPGQKIIIKVKLKAHKQLTHLNIALRLRNKEGVKIYSWGTLNQDIATWAGLSQSVVFWNKTFMEGEEFEVAFESICTLGENLYEIQAVISEENDRYYGSQRMIHWRDEAAFFSVNIKRHEYFFGGVSDMLMKAVYR